LNADAHVQYFPWAVKLQVAAVFIEAAKAARLGKLFHVAAPAALDGKRDQLSMTVANLR
jgi:hypothetical protein